MALSQAGTLFHGSKSPYTSTDATQVLQLGTNNYQCIRKVSGWSDNSFTIGSGGVISAAQQYHKLVIRRIQQNNQQIDYWLDAPNSASAPTGTITGGNQIDTTYGLVSLGQQIATSGTDSTGWDGTLSYVDLFGTDTNPGGSNAAVATVINFINAQWG